MYLHRTPAPKPAYARARSLHVSLCFRFRTPCSPYKPQAKTAAAAPRLCNARHPRTPPLHGGPGNVTTASIKLTCNLRQHTTALHFLATLNSTIRLHYSSTGTLHRRGAAVGMLQAGCTAAPGGCKGQGCSRRGVLQRGCKSSKAATSMANCMPARYFAPATELHLRL